MALQHNLRFPSGALMLSFAWHAEREPSSGLLDIFSHALLSRSCERNLSGSDAAAPPAWLQRAPGLWPRWMSREPLLSRSPGASGVSSPAGLQSRGEGRIMSQTLLLLNNAHRGVCASSSLQGGALGKGTVFSQKKG